MHRKDILTNSILWAAAIIASAILGAPNTLTLLLLPTLAAVSLVTTRSAAPRKACARSSS